MGELVGEEPPGLDPPHGAVDEQGADGRLGGRHRVVAQGGEHAAVVEVEPHLVEERRQGLGKYVMGPKTKYNLKDFLHIFTWTSERTSMTRAGGLQL